MKEHLITLKKSEGFRIFMDELKDRRKEFESILRDAEEVIKVYRAQGALSVLDFIEGLVDCLIEEYEREKEEEPGI